MIRSLFVRRACLPVWMGALLLPAPLLAQAPALGSQTLGRPYWHVFIAYALGILLIGGWVVSIARRLRRVEQRLPGHDG